MTILTTVSASTVLVFRGITRAWRTGTLRTERYQQARLLFDLFSRELSSCVAHPRFPLVGTAADLYFAGTLPGRAGFIERGYWLTEEGELMCHDDASGDGDYATGDEERCGHDVAALTVAYFDGEAWHEGWDGRPGAEQAGRLPKAVRITLTIGEQKPEAFETIVHVPTS